MDSLDERSHDFHPQHPRSLTAKAPEKWWLEDDPASLWGPGIFSEKKLALKLWEGILSFLRWPHTDSPYHDHKPGGILANSESSDWKAILQGAWKTG